MKSTDTTLITAENEYALLECMGLTKSFDDVIAISNINLKVNTNYLGLLGPNGSGKSTLIKLMLKLIHPTDGSIKLGADTHNIRVVPDYPKLPENLTIEQWVTMLEQIYGDPVLIEDVQSLFLLDGTQKISALSAGQYRKAALLPLFYGQPKLIILDEPTNFLDVVARGKVLGLIKDLLRITGSKLILASHRLDEIRLFCEEALILKDGKHVMTADLREDTVTQYSIRVNDPGLLIEFLEDSDIVFKAEDSVVGVEFIVNVSTSIWDLLRNYMEEGGIIQSFRALEKLELLLEDLYK